MAKSLGMIETVGLAAAVEAADAALKSANVELVGYEQTRGGGLILITLTGEVGAVNAAVAAGVAAASRTGRVYAHKIIARTAEGIEALLQHEAMQQSMDSPAEQQSAAIPEAAAPLLLQHQDDAAETTNGAAVDNSPSSTDKARRAGKKSRR